MKFVNIFYSKIIIEIFKWKKSSQRFKKAS